MSPIVQFNKMVPDHKNTWLEALRSGSYKQGHGHLRQSNGQDVFCCLGVLQEVIQPEDWREPDSGIRSWSVPEDSYEEAALNDGEIQERLMEETGFDAGAMQPLIEMNDGQRNEDDVHTAPRINMKTFLEIADWIEEYL